MQTRPPFGPVMPHATHPNSRNGHPLSPDCGVQMTRKGLCQHGCGTPSVWRLQSSAAPCSSFCWHASEVPGEIRSPGAGSFTARCETAPAWVLQQPTSHARDSQWRMHGARASRFHLAPWPCQAHEWHGKPMVHGTQVQHALCNISLSSAACNGAWNRYHYLQAWLRWTPSRSHGM